MINTPDLKEVASKLGTTEDFLLSLEAAWPFEVWDGFIPLDMGDSEQCFQNLKSAPLIHLWKCDSTYGYWNDEGSIGEKAQTIDGKEYTQDQLPPQGHKLITEINRLDHEESLLAKNIPRSASEIQEKNKKYWDVLEEHFQTLGGLENQRRTKQYQLTQMYWTLHLISQGFIYEGDGYTVTAIHSPEWIAGEAKIEKEGIAATYGRGEVAAYFPEEKRKKFRDSLEEIGGIYESWKEKGSLTENEIKTLGNLQKYILKAYLEYHKKTKKEFQEADQRIEVIESLWRENHSIMPSTLLSPITRAFSQSGLVELPPLYPEDPYEPFIYKAPWVGEGLTQLEIEYPIDELNPQEAAVKFERMKEGVKETFKPTGLQIFTAAIDLYEMRHDRNFPKGYATTVTVPIIDIIKIFRPDYDKSRGVKTRDKKMVESFFRVMNQCRFQLGIRDCEVEEYTTRNGIKKFRATKSKGKKPLRSPLISIQGDDPDTVINPHIKYHLGEHLFECLYGDFRDYRRFCLVNRKIYDWDATTQQWEILLQAYFSQRVRQNYFKQNKQTVENVITILKGIGRLPEEASRNTTRTIQILINKSENLEKEGLFGVEVINPKSGEPREKKLIITPPKEIVDYYQNSDAAYRYKKSLEDKEKKRKQLEAKQKKY